MFRHAKFFVIVFAVVILFAITRSDVAKIRELATGNSFFTAQLAETTRLEKEISAFRVNAAAVARGDAAISSDDLKLSFDLLWSRTATQQSKFSSLQIAALHGYQPMLVAFAEGLRSIDATVQSLHAGDREGLARIEAVMQRFAGPMSDMNRDAYAELVKRAVDSTVTQREAMHSLDRIQWMFVIAGFCGFIMLLLQLRRGEKLYAALALREAEIRTLATRDPLTGLNNRRHFDERMAAIDEGRWPGRLSLLLIDLDGFKQVNDASGHAAGDAVLQVAARRLEATAGSDALIARLGGDEFAVVIDGSMDHACNIARAVIRSLSEPVIHDGQSLKVGASVGISAVRPGPTPSATLLKEADSALYEAKAHGRGRACQCFGANNCRIAGIVPAAPKRPALAG
jgi:diguanylate cyclase (GGDEF)-like protein